MDTNELKKWITDYKIEFDILNNFELVFQEYKTECQDEFNDHFPHFEEKNLFKYMYKVALTLIGWGESEQECVIASVRMRYNNHYAGEYRIVYSLNGEFIDDFLVIE